MPHSLSKPGLEQSPLRRNGGSSPRRSRDKEDLRKRRWLSTPLLEITITADKPWLRRMARSARITMAATLAGGRTSQSPPKQSREEQRTCKTCNAPTHQFPASCCTHWNVHVSAETSSESIHMTFLLCAALSTAARMRPAVRKSCLRPGPWASPHKWHL